MKPIKSKKAMVASIILASVALGGVGFSAWVINAADDTKDLSNVQVDVGEFNDNRFTLTAPKLAEDEKVVFDWDGYEGTVVAGSGKDLEDLSFTFTTTLTGNTTELDGIYLRLNTNADLATLIGNGTTSIIQSPLTPSDTGNGTSVIPGTAFTVSGGSGNSSDRFTAAEGEDGDYKWSYSVTYAKETSAYNISVTVNFAWGQLFKYDNPTRLENKLSDEQLTGLKTLDTLSEKDIKLNFVVGAIAKTTPTA